MLTTKTKMCGLIHFILTISVCCIVGSYSRDIFHCKSLWLCNKTQQSRIQCRYNERSSSYLTEPGLNTNETIHVIELSGFSHETFSCLETLIQTYNKITFEVWSIFFINNVYTTDEIFVRNGDLSMFPYLKTFLFVYSTAPFYGDDIFQMNTNIEQIIFNFNRRYEGPYPNFLVPKEYVLKERHNTKFLPKLNFLLFKNWWFKGNIPKNALSYFDNLQNLTLVACVSSEEHIHSISQATSLRNLTLSESKVLTILPKQFLMPDNTTARHNISLYSSLVDLQLHNNAITEIRPSAFEYLRNIQTLSLDGNPLQLLSSEIFRDLPNLRYFSVRDCALKQIDINGIASKIRPHNWSPYEDKDVIELLRVTANLKVFVAANNQISELTQHTFFNLSALEVIDLSNNKIVALKSNTFNVLPSLKELNLSHNKIKTDTYSKDAFQCVQNLGFLDLRFNDMSSFPYNPNVNTACNRSYCDKDRKFFAAVSVFYFGNPFICDCVLFSSPPFPSNMFAEDYGELGCTYSFPGFKPFNTSFLFPQGMPSRHYHFQDVTNITGCPFGCQCFSDCYALQHYVFCENSSLKSVPQDLPASIITLKMSKNLIVTLNIQSFQQTLRIEFIDLSQNMIRSVAPDTFSNLAKLQLLDLSLNQIRYLSDQTMNLFSYEFSKIIMLKNFRYGLYSYFDLSMVRLEGNPFECSCHMRWLLESDKVGNKESLICNNKHHFVDWLKENCLIGILKYVVITLGGLLALVSSIAAIFINRRNISVMIFHKTGIRINWILGRNREDWDKKYDGFISYSKKDEAFVLTELLPFLEECDAGFRICIHERDFIPGNPIIGNIENAISQSRRTIIVITSNFIESVWCKTEFKMAHYKVLSEKNRVILIAMEDVAKLQKKLDKEINSYMSLNTFLNRNDMLFWQKLIVAMPNWKENPSNRSSSENEYLSTYNIYEERENIPLIANNANGLT